MAYFGIFLLVVDSFSTDMNVSAELPSVLFHTLGNKHADEGSLPEIVQYGPSSSFVFYCFQRI